MFKEANLMRALKGLFCAAVLTACLAPSIRADEYTKQTFLTFSGPVQLPGITLPAGTYQFRLADPESGRRTLQVWDKEGSKLYTTLLTIPDQRMAASSEPVVMFTERASGEAQPIRAWFYPNDTYGQEFVYPKDQAMRIAKDTHSSVLAFNDDAKDASTYKSAKVGRMDENGQMTDADKDSASAASTTASDHDAQSAATQASAADTAAQSSTAQSDASLSRPARSTTDQAAAEPRSTSAMPSANRSDASTPVGTSGTASTASSAATTTSEANKDNMPSDRAVGTTGSTTSSNGANRTGQAASGANAAAPQARNQGSSANQTPASANQPSSANRGGAAQTSGTNDNARAALPHTAGSMTLVQLLAGLSLAAAFALRVFRSRSAHYN
jgi:hypothetical protein